MGKKAPRFTLAAIACVLITLLACEGGETHFLRSPASLTNVADMCDEWRGWRERCAIELNDPTFYQGDFYERCKADPRWTLLWDRATNELESCFNTLSCDGNDDRCFGQALVTLKVDPAMDELYTGCLPRAKECPGVLDDECGNVLLYSDPGRTSFARCLELDCSQLDACLKDPAAFSP